MGHDERDGRGNGDLGRDPRQDKPVGRHVRFDTCRRIAFDRHDPVARSAHHQVDHWDRIASLTAGDVGELGANEGAIVTVDGHRVAAFRHDDGTIAAVSATCTHLGFIVDFNNAERTWDCPCHGSRFALDGHVIDGPATQGLGTVHVAPQSSADPPRQE
jgi:Rieske Fe-S protein